VDKVVDVIGPVGTSRPVFAYQFSEGRCASSALYYSGIRVTELATADAENLGAERGHRILTIVRKGGFISDVVLPPPAAHAVDLYLAGRTHGPLIATATGNRLRRQDVNVLLDSLAVRRAQRVPQAEG
jgi:site-specific recombinase XerD